MSIPRPNKPDAANPARTLWLAIAIQWRRVADLERWPLRFGMRIRSAYTVTAGVLASLLLVSTGAERSIQPQPETRPVQYQPTEGRLRIEGSSVVHDWQAETREIHGFLQVGADFPVLFPRSFAPGELRAHAEVSLSVRSLKSIEKDGSPYSAAFDEIMYDKLARRGQTTINFRLEKLVWTAVKGDSFAFDSVGELVIGGVTNAVHIPVSVTRLPAGQLQLKGTTSIKQTDFGIPPPIVDTDQPRRDYSVVKVSFEWTVQRPKTINTANK
jgi:YceI-like domain